MAIIIAGAKTGYRKRILERSARFDLHTDSEGLPALPSAVQHLPLSGRCLQTEQWAREVSAAGGPAALAVFSHESLRLAVESSAWELLLREDALTYLPVHLQVIPELDLDLLALEPRIGHGTRAGEHFSQDVRLVARAAPGRQYLEALRGDRSWWARHSLALHEEWQRAGEGIRPLQRMWQRQEMTLLQRAFVLRNLAVALLRGRQHEQADSLLAPGVEAFPDYGELRYLAALNLVLQGRGSKAVGLLERAARMGAGAWPGSGGETWYRSRWLLGTLCADLGRDQLAYENFVPSLLAKPAFGPGVEALFRMQLPARHVERLYCPVQQLKIREPQYAERAEEFLGRHGVGDRFRVSRAPVMRAATEAASLVIEGPLFDSSSLARLNREIAATLIRAEAGKVSLAPTAFATRKAESFPDGQMLLSHARRPPASPALTIRQGWPPDLRAVPGRNTAAILHWEYSAVPRAWVEAANRNLQRVWTPSRFTRDAFLQAGLRPDILELLPLGFSPEAFSPEGERWLPEGARGFVFLFVGGVIRRKGIDLLLDAYREAFQAGDDVTLVIKASGSDSFYEHNSLLGRVKRYARELRSPRIVLLDADMPDERLAMLYRAAQVLVHPYRAEGFGLPLLEAMACGRPVITTDAGPAPEFCPRECSVLLPAREEEIPDEPPPLGRLSGPMTWFEPDPGALVLALRQACENAGQMSAMGSRAAQRAHESRAWLKLAPVLADQVSACLRLTGAAGECEVGA